MIKIGLFAKKEKRSETADGAQNLTPDIDSVLLRALLGNDNIVTKSQALQIPTVQACITLIANTVASLPVKLYEKKSETVSEITHDKRIKLLNGDTGDTLNSVEMIQNWVKDYFLGKGAYTYIQKNAYNEAVGLFYVDEEQVCINSNYQPIFKQYMINVSGDTYTPDKFLKIFLNTKGDGRSRSIIEENPLVLSVAYNTMIFENALMKKGGNKKGFLKSKTKLTKQVMDEIREAWRNLYGNGSENMIILNDGMDFAESSNTSVEMQLNERKSSNAAEICSLFGVPLEMISGKASEAVEMLFVKNAVMPVVNAIEAALDADLLLESEKDSFYFAFDTRELTRGSILTRYNAYALGMQHNFLQLDEIRKLEDLPETGFNFIRLGLQDVLLDPKTNKVYTPNTNAMVSLDGKTFSNGLQSENNKT